MLGRAIELILAWYNHLITDEELLDELRFVLARAQKGGWNL